MIVEEWILLFLNNFTGKYFYLDFSFFFLAHIFPYILVAPFIYLIARNYKKYGWFVGEVFFAGLFGKFVLGETIRYFFPRIRPFEIIEEINLLLPYKDSASYPSGHAVFFFAVSTVVYFHNKKIGIIFFILSSLIAISRIISGVHWPLDIFAGVLLGILSGIIARELVKFIRKENKNIKKK